MIMIIGNRNVQDDRRFREFDRYWKIFIGFVYICVNLRLIFLGLRINLDKILKRVWLCLLLNLKMWLEGDIEVFVRYLGNQKEQIGRD